MVEMSYVAWSWLACKIWGYPWTAVADLSLIRLDSPWQFGHFHCCSLDLMVILSASDRRLHLDQLDGSVWARCWSRMPWSLAIWIGSVAHTLCCCHAQKFQNQNSGWMLGCWVLLAPPIQSATPFLGANNQKLIHYLRKCHALLICPEIYNLYR